MIRTYVVGIEDRDAISNMTVRLHGWGMSISRPRTETSTMKWESVDRSR